MVRAVLVMPVIMRPRHELGASILQSFAFGLAQCLASESLLSNGRKENNEKVTLQPEEESEGGLVHQVAEKENEGVTYKSWHAHFENLKGGRHS